jgi:zeaxanthin glucosyltransferase
MTTPMHVALIPLPERSSFSASFKLAKQLEASGIRITYIGPPVSESYVAIQGLGYQALLPDPIIAENKQHPRGRLLAWWRNLQTAHAAFGRYLIGLTAALDRLDAWLSDNPISAALIEPMMWEFAPPILRRKIPIVGLTNTLTARFDTNFPPVYSNTIVADHPTALARLGYSVEWSALILKLAAQHALESLHALTAVGPLRYRRSSPRSRVVRSGGRLTVGEYGLRLRVPELVLAPKEIDFSQVSQQSGRYYAGSCVDVDRRDPPFDWGLLEPHRGVVYCSLGTYNQFYVDATRLFRSVVEAVRREKDLQAIIHVGNSAAIAELGPQPTRIRLVENVPQLEILRHATAFITHGGIGAVREGLFFGVPMIVFPCWLDQFGNAARLVHHGIALRGDIHTVTADIVRQLIAQARSTNIQRAVNRMRDIFRQQESCLIGVQWLRDYLTAVQTDP